MFKNFRTLSLMALTALAAAVVAPAALAGTTSGSFAVTANVAAACKVDSSTAIAFGNYDPANVNATTDLAGQGNLKITCVKSTVATVSLDTGLNSSGGTCAVPNRRMKTGTSTYLNYKIFTTSGYTQEWGCTAGTNTSSFTSATSASPVTLVTYGKVPAGQDVPTGAYADTVTFTVSF
jgi:spore coat protein U-like protein